MKKRKIQRNTNWGKIKIFAQPEYRMPIRLTRASLAPGGRAPAWLKAGIEAGLVEMAAPSVGSRAGGLLNPINGAPDPVLPEGGYKELIRKALERTVRELQEKK